MWKILMTILLTSAFFILFFEQGMSSKNKSRRDEKVSTAHGFIEDTRDAFIVPVYPTQVMNRDITGKIIPNYGDIGDFVPYSSVPEDHWLHGFPHEKA
ncbi:hypothetical protein OlV7_078c [Ostreococcus lucimarinus virus 7]|jgi:hypothetical protein|uniref:hypothetical protein n=1 Tax=Ostreococcus lucimarinus virus 7 TaxID=1663209 RepID=UPI0006D07687|nr:hypothetical protein AP054_gp078 [Ostreococcus lucimarinus virus 7]ALI95710.1 hypothetical protein OlV7_078c [Ostreococcus lucimarinus virus 7]QBP06771.1 hypothetical protein OlV7_gene77 [Ostreococcus lucimarinus virus 7]